MATMTIEKVTTATASRQWSKDVRFYVSNLPGDGGVDWGYDTRYEKAIALSPYWQRRFAADCRRVRAVAQFSAASQ